MKKIILLAWLVWVLSVISMWRWMPPVPLMGNPQYVFSGFNPGATGFPAITLDASCKGNITSGNNLPCSSAMTVTAGDLITCNVTSVDGGNNITSTVMDPTNGFYDNVYGLVHPSVSTSWVTTAVFQNSAGGSITPELFDSKAANTENTINCYAWKGVPASKALDGGSVNQTQTATSTNPTSGTAAAPTNNNEVVVAYMSRSSATAPGAGTGWSPTGTLTLVGTTNVRQASEYQIQTTATAVNGAFTATGSVAYADSQLAVLQNGTLGGYRSLTGFFGAPAIAKTNGATVTAADLSGSTTTLFSINCYNSPCWQLQSTAATYDTSVNPTGTGSIMVQGVTHSFGDAGTSIKIAAASNATVYSYHDIMPNTGQPIWFSFFTRIGSAGISSGQECDTAYVTDTATQSQNTLQFWYDTTNGVYLKLESDANGSGDGTSPFLMWGGTLDTDYWVQFHMAGVNEYNHQVLVYSKSGSTWSLAGTLNYSVLCALTTTQPCTGNLPTPTATQTGTASSGSTALTLGSGTSTINGQLAYDPTGNCLPWPTLVESGGGTTSITLSQGASCAISGTTVDFFTLPSNATTGIVAATNGTVSAGSTALTVVSPNVGTIAVGQPVGGSGIVQGTIVSAVSGTSVTLSIPASAAMTNGGVSFWTSPSAAIGSPSVAVAKYSSCSMASPVWFSGLTYDQNSAWRAFAPN
jgi:hypothetical protein